MTKKIYVGNLSYNTTEVELQQFFEAQGEVTFVNVVKDRDTGRSRGFGFIEMATEEEANAAIEGLNGKSLDGRELKIAEARPRKPRTQGGGGSGGGRYNNNRRSDSRESRW